MRALSNHSMHQPVATHAPRPVPFMAAGKTCGRQRAQVTTAAVESVGASRRQWLLASTTSALLLAAQGLAPQPGLSASAIEIINDAEGFGKRAARKGDLLLLHYVGTIKATGAVFDSTRGGLTYRDGGPGTNRPVIIRLGGDPVPGVCAGLKAGLEGMRIGGKRTFVVPPELGFRGSVLAPYALVPEGSALTYDVELIRLSARGPDELTKGIDRCGQGGAAQQVANCGDIEPAEFLINFPVDYQLQVSGNEDNS